MSFKISEFMNFSDSLVSVLDRVSEKIDEISNKIELIEQAVGDTTTSFNSDYNDTPNAYDNPALSDGNNEYDDSNNDNGSNFSYIVVRRKNRPWGNTVIPAVNFSNKEYDKLIPTLFSTKEQAQRALTSYNVNGENFSIRYNNVKNLLNL